MLEYRIFDKDGLGGYVNPVGFLLSNDGYIYDRRYGFYTREGLLIEYRIPDITDKNGKAIYVNDIVALENNDKDNIIATCRFGTIEREIVSHDGKSTNNCNITGFYFEVNGKPTLPIVNNYLGISDCSIMEVIGTVHDDEVKEKLDKMIGDGENDFYEKSKKTYYDVLVSGMFYEWYPHLSGNWEKDEVEWLKNS